MLQLVTVECCELSRGRAVVTGLTSPIMLTGEQNDLTIGWQNLNPLIHPNATLAPQAKQARTSGENMNYTTLAP